jgi:hypothetical protein
VPGQIDDAPSLTNDRPVFNHAEKRVEATAIAPEKGSRTEPKQAAFKDGICNRAPKRRSRPSITSEKD